MSYQNQKPVDTWLVAGVILLACGTLLGFTWGIMFSGNQERQNQLQREQNAEMTRYLESIGGRFSNDSDLTADERINILEHDHRINADDLGNLRAIENRYDREIETVHSTAEYLAFITFLICIFSGLILIAFSRT